ncbi:MAG: VaFE repeat-containing surface-anchored protein [Clostridiales bacterium]|nr:VaFE repeat-containing surface-anchored protein [Clostridiales bacterium]
MDQSIFFALKNDKRRVRALVIALIIVLIGSTLMTENALAFSGKKGSVYTVTSGKQIRYGQGDGGYSNSKMTDLNDGLGNRYSYCVQPSRPTPQATRVTVDKVVTDDADTGKWNALRNIIYYSPSYPGYDNNVKKIRDNYYTGDFDKDWGIAHLALSFVYEGRPEDMATYKDTKASDLGEIWTKAKKLGNALWKDGTTKDDAVPDSFKVFVSFMEGVQDMVVGYMESPGSLKIKKSATLESLTKGNDLYSLEGAKYEVFDEKDKSMGVLTIDEKGESDAMELPAGNYTVKEIKAPKGYALDEEVYKVKVTSEDELILETEDKPIRAMIELLLKKKLKGSKGKDTAEGPSLKGAVYEVKFMGDGSSKALAVWHMVTDDKGEISGVKPKLDKTYENSELYKDEDGKAVFPLGTYEIREVKAPEGYVIDKEKHVIKVEEDGTDNVLTKAYNSVVSYEDIIRGGVKVTKFDLETGKSEPLGSASFEGICFTLKNMSESSVLVREELGKKGEFTRWVGPGEDIGSINLKYSEESGAWEAATLSDDLPYGKYSIMESKTSSTYQRTDKTEHIFEIKEDGKMYSMDDLGETLIFRNQVYRSDLEGTKIADSSSQRFGYVPFKITSLTSGECHVVVTDVNGYFFTGDRRTEDEIFEDGEGAGLERINPFDDLLQKDEISMEEMESRAGDVRLGVWFGSDKADVKLGALPMDKYVLEEMRCEANAGYTLQKIQFEVNEKSTHGIINLATITDDVPEMGTTASVGGKSDGIKPEKDIVLIDIVEYSGLRKGETYMLEGRLVDRSTGETVKDAEGNDVTATKEFTAPAGSGKVKVEFHFDGSNLNGMDTVVFEKLYDSEGNLICSHEDPDDEFQRLTWEDEPEEPGEPEEPDEPGEPEEPEEPDKPDKPEKPEKPKVPDKPEKPKAPVKQQVPKTGDTSGIELWSTILLLSVSAAARHKKEQE